jgi:ubiquitin-protein ligase
MSAATITAAKRLQHDVKDFNADPIPNISAQPIGDDLFKWSVNMVAPSGPYAGVPIHLHLTFPQNYPTNPPKVELLTAITHPNVYGDWICLDMIKVGTTARGTKHQVSQHWLGCSVAWTLAALSRS